MCLTRERSYTAALDTLPRARNFVSAALVADLHPGGWQTADDAALIVSELITASLESQAAQIVVRLDAHYDHVRIEVTAHACAKPFPPFTGTRARILRELTGQITVETRMAQTSGVAYIACAPAYTVKLHCERRPPPLAAGLPARSGG